jgi:superfamily II DNA or RNA helicase
MQQRDYQSDLIRQIYQSWKSGSRRVLAQLPTGAGKTVIFSHIARDCLSRWVEKFITMSLRVKLSQTKELQELWGFYISLHSSVFLSLPT